MTVDLSFRVTTQMIKNAINFEQMQRYKYMQNDVKGIDKYKIERIYVVITYTNKANSN